MSVLPPLRRLVAALLALAVLVAAVLLVAEVVTAAAGRPSLLVSHGRVARWLEGHPWSDRLVVALSVAALVLGLLLLALALARGGAARLPLASEDPTIDAGIARRSLQGAVGRWAAEVDGVAEARARVRAGRTTVVAVPGRRDVRGLREQVAARVRDRLDGLGLGERADVDVRIEGSDV